MALVPVVVYAALRPLLCHGYAGFLDSYQSLPTVSVLPTAAGHWDDLSLYLLFLVENISELKSYKYMKVSPVESLSFVNILCRDSLGSGWFDSRCWSF